MATTVSNLNREIETSASEESVPLLGLALEDAEAELAEIRTDEEQKNDQSQARIMAFQGSTELRSIIQAKDTHETMVGNLYIRADLFYTYLSNLKLLQIKFCTNYKALRTHALSKLACTKLWSLNSHLPYTRHTS